MKANSYKFKSVEEYISTFPESVQIKLEKLRIAIKEAAPTAQEVISYNMPAIKQKGVLVYYAAAKNHIGFYPTSSGVSVFKQKLTDFETTKGTIKFPLDKPIPITLVKRIVKFRAQEDQEKIKSKRSLTIK